MISNEINLELQISLALGFLLRTFLLLTNYGSLSKSQQNGNVAKRNVV